MLLTTNILQKTFLIRQGDSLGTAFAIEADGREYLVTAKHVVSDKQATLEILHAETWKQLPVTGIHHHDGQPDIAVISLSVQIAPRHPAELTIAGMAIGQSVLFAGFPFGWNHTQYNINNGYPMPFVKAAILSTIIFKEQTNSLFLDGHNNPGFSGGPIAAEHVPPKDPKYGPKIIGVISGFQNEYTPHPSEVNPPLTHIGGYPIGDSHVHLTNSGFIIGYDIKHVLEVIEGNPYGFQLKA